MRPLSSPTNTSETTRAFEDAAEAWLLRARNPQADTVVLEAVQRWQERPSQRSAAEKTLPTQEAWPAPSVRVAAALHKVQGDQPCGTWVLPSDRPILVGRSEQHPSQLDINLWPDAGVSRRHALIWFDRDTWWIEDLRSKNGTFLAETDIREQRAVRLAFGMTIRLGRTVLSFAASDPVVSGAEGTGPAS